MLAYTHARNCAHAQLRTRPAPSTLLLITHTLRTLYARTPTRTSSAVRLWTAAVTDRLRAVQPLAGPSAPQAPFLPATNDENTLNRLFVRTFAETAEELGLKFGARTCDTAAHYLEVARSTRASCACLLRPALRRATDAARTAA